MGRKPTKKGAIPHLRQRVRGKVTYYFYDHGGKPRREEPLGTDRGLALKRWAELERESKIPAAAVLTFRHVAERYMAEVVPRKAARTQEDNRKEAAKLLAFFDDPPAPLDAIRPVNVRQYLTWRTKDGSGLTRANREKSLLSHIWNYARDKGYTDLPNPCAGIKGFKESGRDAYVEDDAYTAIWNAAEPCLQDAMDLAYFTGQRPADVLRLSDADVRDGAIHVRQAKTGAKLRIQVEGELATVIERIRARRDGYRVHCTRLVVNAQGRPIGVNALSRKWAIACAAAGVVGLQFRDLRAKAATDKADDAGDIRQAQKQLGHSSVRTTEGYTRNRRGTKVTPTLRKRPKAK